MATVLILSNWVNFLLNFLELRCVYTVKTGFDRKPLPMINRLMIVHVLLSFCHS